MTQSDMPEKVSAERHIDEALAQLEARARSEDEGGSEAAAERAMMGMEAQSDLWAERVNLNDLIEDIVNVGRLSPKAPHDVRESLIKRQRELIDALMRQAYLEGYLEGGLSRKAYDSELDAQTAALLRSLRAERDEARALIDTLQRERDEAVQKLNHEAHVSDLRAQERDRAEAEVTRLREAVEPFAAMGDVLLAEAPPNAVAAWGFKPSTGEPCFITLDNFRRARSVLSKDTP